MYVLKVTITCKLHPSACRFYIDTEWVILNDGIIQQIYSSFIIGWTFFLKKVQDNTLIVKLKFVNWKIEGYLRIICFLYGISPINTLMFLKNIGLIEKNIGTFENKHTVDWKQTYGPLFTNSYCLKTIDCILIIRFQSKEKFTHTSKYHSD